MTKMQEIRTLMGMNGAEVARRIGISKQALYNYEKGRREAPYDVLLKMAKLYGVSIEALLGQKESAPAEDSRSAIVERIGRLSDDDLQLLLDFMEALNKTRTAKPADKTATGPVESYDTTMTQIRNLIKDPGKNFQEVLRLLDSLPKTAEGMILAYYLRQTEAERPKKSKSLKSE